jgi:hypothetical protein
LPHVAGWEIPGKQLGVHDGFLGVILARIHASFRWTDAARSAAATLQ